MRTYLEKIRQYYIAEENRREQIRRESYTLNGLLSERYTKQFVAAMAKPGTLFYTKPGR